MATYPTWAAGQRVTAALLTASQPQYIIKNGNTSRASTTTVATDPDLQITLAANGLFIVEMTLYFAGLNPGGLKTAWVVPAGATGNRSVVGPGSSALEVSADNISMRSGVHGFATTIPYGTRNHATNQVIASETAMVGTTTAGVLALQWSQVTSSPTATLLSGSSWMRITRIG